MITEKELKELVTDKVILKYDNMKLYDENMKLLESITDAGVNIVKLESEKEELIEKIEEYNETNGRAYLKIASLESEKAELMSMLKEIHNQLPTFEQQRRIGYLLNKLGEK